MKNFQLDAECVSGESIEYDFETGRNVVDWLAGMDIDPQVASVCIRVYDESGRRILIQIPNNDTETVSVRFDPPLMAA
jgi:hypothetical protein